MRVVLNSDVLHHEGTLVQGELARGLRRLFVACAERGHEVVVPLTTRMEFDRHQNKQVEGERKRLSEAYALLDSYNIQRPSEDPQSVVAGPNLIQLIAQNGVQVIEIPPEPADLMEAHRRAALHEPPHPPDSKSDEMRDLVIWAQALRLANSDPDGALLISRDKVHVHPRGDEEAARCGLVRCSSVEEALEFLEVRSPAGALIEDLLLRTWEALRAVDNQLPTTLDVRSVTNASFHQGESGLSRAKARVKSGIGDNVLESDAMFTIDQATIVMVELSNLTVSGRSRESVVARPQIPYEAETADSASDLESLREVLGE